MCGVAPGERAGVVSGGETGRIGGVHDLVKAAGLTERERQALRQLLKGRSESEAAKAMRLGVATVHTHVKRIYVKFGVNSRRELMAKFLAGIKV